MHMVHSDKFHCAPYFVNWGWYDFNFKGIGLSVKAGACIMRRNKLKKLVKAFEIPEDVMGDLSRLTMLGNKQLLIENHRGIIEYTPTYIRLNLVDGFLVIKGTQLILGNLQAEQILVEGKVGEIHYDT